MTKFLSYVVLVPALAALTLVADVSAANDSSQALQDGLKLIEKGWRSEFYAKPDMNWSAYREIQLQDAPVAFRHDWQRDQNRSNPFKVDDEAMENIKSSLSKQFREVFTEELSKNGSYTLTASTGEHVLLIKPTVVDLDVVAPDTMRTSFSRQYADSTTRMTLKLEFYDSVTGELLATSSDRLEDPRRGYLNWTTGASNRADSKRLLRQWAAGLLQRLEEARSNRLTSSGTWKEKAFD